MKYLIALIIIACVLPIIAQELNDKIHNPPYSDTPKAIGKDDNRGRQRFEPMRELHPPEVKDGDIPLYPVEAELIQLLELKGNDLKRALYIHPNLDEVTGITIVNYRIPGPPFHAQWIINYYRMVLREPDWKPFFASSQPETDNARIAFQGSKGFVSISATSKGALVTFVEGALELSAMSQLELVVRQLIAGTETTPPEVKKAIEAVLNDWKSGNKTKAVSAIQAIINKHPTADLAFYHMALMMIDQKKTSSALSYFRKAIAISPLNTAYRIQYANLLLKQGDFDSALYELQQASSIDPWQPQIHIAVSKLMYDRNDYSGAERAIRKGIENGAITSDNYVLLGKTLEKLNRKASALNAYKDALKLNSKNKTAEDAVKRLEK